MSPFVGVYLFFIHIYNNGKEEETANTSNEETQREEVTMRILRLNGQSPDSETPAGIHANVY